MNITNLFANGLLAFAALSLVACGASGPELLNTIANDDEGKRDENIQVTGDAVDIDHFSNNSKGSARKTATSYIIDTGDEVREFAIIGTENGQPVLEKINDDQDPTRPAKYQGIAIRGQDVIGVGFSKNNVLSPFDEAKYVISGEASDNVPASGRANYRGYYTADDLDDMDDAIRTGATLEVNFDDGKITGNADGALASEITFDGQATSDGISMTITEGADRYDAKGAFFGDAASEMAVGYEHESRVGLLYGERE